MSEDLPMPPAGSGPVPTPGGFVAPTVEELGVLLPAYEITELIAEGGMGAVYKGSQPRLARTVAIKVLPLEAGGESGSGGSSAGDMNFAERFEREAQAMAKMHHSRVVGVHDFGETSQGHSYIVMEFVEGTDLHHLITAGSLTQKQILAIITQICDALSYAHAQGIVHRDIKPANIMLDVEGQVKVADFGLAKLTGSDHGAQAQAQLTMTNMAMGTPDYVAPEQLQIGVEVDGRADLYALGVMIYEMLTGKVPRGAFKWPSEVNAEVDPRMDRVVEKAMQQDRDDRYQEVSDLWREVEKISATPAPAKGPVLLTGTGAVSRGPGPVPGSLSSLKGTGRVAIKPGGGPTRRVNVKPATRPGMIKEGRSPGMMAGLAAGGVGLLVAVVGWLVLSGGGKPELSGQKPEVIGAESGAKAKGKAKGKAKAAGKTGTKEKEKNIEDGAYAGLVEAPDKLDLMRYVKVEEDGIDGKWSFLSRGALEAKAVQNGCHLALPVVFAGEDEALRDYEVAVKLWRAEGSGPFAMFLPLPEGEVKLELDGAAEGKRLSGIGGVDFAESTNPTRIEGEQIPMKKAVEFVVRVRAPKTGDVDVIVTRMGTPLMEWSGAAGSLRRNQNVPGLAEAMDAKRLVIQCGRKTRFEVGKLELKLGVGAVTLLRPAHSKLEVVKEPVPGKKVEKGEGGSGADR